MIFEDKLTALGMKCLTVAGAFVAGWVLGIMLSLALNRWAFKQKMPDVMKKALKVVCAVLLALLVAVMIFGGGAGGGAWAGGGADGKAAGTATDQDKNKSDNSSPDQTKDEKKQPAAVPDPRPTEVTIRVTVLGGTDVRDEKFYLIDDDGTPKTLGEVKAALAARKSKDSRKIVVAILRSERHPLPLEHAGWTKLVKAVQDEIKLDITFPATK